MTQRETLYNQQHGLCFWCGNKMLEIGTGESLPLSPTLDHVIPKAAGGGGFLGGNVVCACYDCNHLRGTFNSGAMKLREIERGKEIGKLQKVFKDKNQVIMGLKDIIISYEKDNKRLVNIVIRLVEHPWWKRILHLPINGN